MDEYLDRALMSLCVMSILIIALFCRIFDLIDIGDFLIIAMLNIGFISIIYSLGNLKKD